MLFPITIGLRRSRFLERALIVVLLLAGAVIAAFPRMLEVRILCAVLSILLCAQAWRRLTPTITALRLERDGGVQVLPAAASEWVGADLIPGASVHPRLTVFRLNVAGRRHHIIVASDVMPADDFRRLRVFLRWRAEFSESADGGE